MVGSSKIFKVANIRTELLTKIRRQAWLLLFKAKIQVLSGVPLHDLVQRHLLKEVQQILNLFKEIQQILNQLKEIQQSLNRLKEIQQI